MRVDQKKVVIFGDGCPTMRACIQALLGAQYRVLVACPHPYNPFVQDVTPKIGQLSAILWDAKNIDATTDILKHAFAVVNVNDLALETRAAPYTDTVLDRTVTLAKAAKAASVTHFVQIAPLLSQEGPTSAFERTHQMAQEALLTLVSSATVLRCGLIYGRDQHFFVPTAAQVSVVPFACIFGDRKAKFQPLYISDLTRAIVAVLKTPATSPGIFELAGPDVCTLGELTQMTLRTIHRKAIVMSMPKILGRAFVGARRLVGYPLLTLGEAPLLHSDGFLGGYAPGLKELGIAPTPLATVLPTLLARFKPHF
ncbi:MAG: hypothetical protein C0514_05275 [Candidatus Puniceispirillum sp.]|nr:hypothetical protein [Candidatus Puniceispirillum sp.]